MRESRIKQVKQLAERSLIISIHIVHISGSLIWQVSKTNPARAAIFTLIVSPGTALATGLFLSVLQATPAIAGGEIKHVLLISVDGLQGVDLQYCITRGTCPFLKKLTEHGLTYTNARTTSPSDSFPGLLAQLTGGTSKSTGVFYDDSYDRTLFAPAGNPPAPCKTGPGVTRQPVYRPIR
jgi:hypothetical protein